MTTTTNYTAEAKELLGGFVQRAGKSFLMIRASNVFGDQETVRITPDNLAEFYATEARNITSGIRTLAGLSGDWRSANWRTSPWAGSRGSTSKA